MRSILGLELGFCWFFGEFVLSLSFSLSLYRISIDKTWGREV